MHFFKATGLDHSLSSELLAFLDGSLLSVLSIIPIYLFVIKPQSISFSRLSTKSELLLSGIETVKTPIVICSEDGKIIFANKGFCEKFKYHSGEAIGMHLSLIYTKNDLPDFNKRVEIIKKEGFYSGYVENIDRDGIKHNHMLEVSAINADKRNYFVGVYSELSEFLKLQKIEKEESKIKSMKAVVGGFAHHFNNILQGLNGNLYKISNSSTEVKAMREIRQLEGLSIRAAGIIQELMHFSGQNFTDFKEVKLIPGLKECLKKFDFDTVDIKLEDESCDYIIYGDEESLTKAFCNIFQNAYEAYDDVNEDDNNRKYEKQKSLLINIRSCRKKDCIEQNNCIADFPYAAIIEITNFGKEMETTDPDILFEPFFTEKNPFKFKGLGLSAVKGILQNHKAILNIESNDVQTTFKICFPKVENI